MASLTVSFTPTKGDLIRLGYVGIRARPLVFWFSVTFFVIIPWVVVVLGLIALSFGAPLSWTSIILLLVLPLFFACYFGFIPVLITRGAATLQGTHTYEFTNVGVKTSGPGFSNQLSWTALSRCIASSHGFVFMSGKLPLLSVPGRVLTEAAREELLRLSNDQSLTVTIIA